MGDELKRYRWYYNGMLPDSSGGLCKYEDAAATIASLQAQLAQARDQYETAEGCRKLYKRKFDERDAELQQAREQVERHATDYNTLRDRYDGLVADMNQAAQKIAVAHVTEQQLRDRLAGAMEWEKASAETLKHGDFVLIQTSYMKPCAAVYKNDFFTADGCRVDFNDVMSLVRIKPTPIKPSGA